MLHLPPKLEEGNIKFGLWITWIVIGLFINLSIVINLSGEISLFFQRQ